MHKLLHGIILFSAIFSLREAQTLSNKDFFKFMREERQKSSCNTKLSVAQFDGEKNLDAQSQNSDMQVYADFRGNFGKGLDHLSSGFINPSAFNSMLKAIYSGNQSDFDNIQMGMGITKLINPQGLFAYSLTGIDGWKNAIRPAPSFSSLEAAGEMVELYWTVLARDVPFNAFATDPIVASAVTELNTLSVFNGPRESGAVTPETFLRGNTPGDLVGPYVSQFLYQEVPYGSTTIPPEQTVPVGGATNDFLTNFSDWYTNINGGPVGSTTAFEPTPIFLRTPRDLAEYVHGDSPGQGAFNAALILLSYGDGALDPSNPYLGNPTQVGFVTFNVSQVLELVRTAIHESLKAAWYQKWQVNTRARPEEYGFYVQKQKADGLSLGINSELISSTVLTDIFATFGSYFLPQAYPEGCPTHPSYPAGHATLMGAAVTILKAFFNEDFVIPSPIEPNATNDALIPYVGTLTVGGELNKLASNIALGRDHAGVHYRSDGYEGLLLGEKVAIDILNNTSFLFNESFSGFTLTKFNGSTVKVGKKR